MIKRAEEMLACYFWIRLEGIVALWYLKSDHEFVNRIIDVMTRWAFSTQLDEKLMKVIDADQNTDNVTRMIPRRWRYCPTISRKARPRKYKKF